MHTIFMERYFQVIQKLAGERGTRAFVAGGGLRDRLIGREGKDLDFALAAYPGDLPRLFAEQVDGRFFWLDRERLQSRVVKRVGEGTVTFDFAPLRGAVIEDDLRLRDFTVNAMAVDLSDPERLIDPLHGQDDLRDRLIRGCSSHALIDDPLRLLRGVRLSVVLGFAIEKLTCHDIKDKAHLLELVAAERIRDEFMQILAAPGIGASLTMLRDLGLLQVLLPAGLRGNLAEPGCSDGIRAAAGVEEAASRCLEAAAGLSRDVESGVTVLALVKLAAFIGRAAPAHAQQWGERLRLGSDATRVLATLANWERVPTAIAGEPGERTLFRFFHDHRPVGLEVALLALARGEVSPELWESLVQYRFGGYDEEAPDLLLSGTEIMELLGIGSGPAVGAAMERLREAEAGGLVGSKDEAREFLRKYQLTKEEPMS